MFLRRENTETFKNNVSEESLFSAKAVSELLFSSVTLMCFILSLYYCSGFRLGEREEENSCGLFRCTANIFPRY